MSPPPVPNVPPLPPRGGTPGRSSSVLRDFASGGRKGDSELLVAAGDLAVELAREGCLQAAANRGPLGDARGEQVLAGDLEPHVTPLARVAVEPFRTERTRDEQLRRIPARGQADSLRGALRRGRRQLADLRQRADDGEHHGELVIGP